MVRLFFHIVSNLNYWSLIFIYTINNFFSCHLARNINSFNKIFIKCLKVIYSNIIYLIIYTVIFQSSDCSFCISTKWICKYFELLLSKIFFYFFTYFICSTKIDALTLYFCKIGYIYS